MPDPIKTKIELVPKIINGQNGFLKFFKSIIKINTARKKVAIPAVYKT